MTTLALLHFSAAAAADVVTKTVKLNYFFNIDVHHKDHHFPTFFFFIISLLVDAIVQKDLKKKEKNTHTHTCTQYMYNCNGNQTPDPGSVSATL